MATPFGMLFEEKITDKALSIHVLYDPQEQLSFCWDEHGQSTPFVTFGFITMGATGTGAATKQASDQEDTDPDPKPRPPGTQTVTEIQAETTDIERWMISNI